MTDWIDDDYVRAVTGQEVTAASITLAQTIVGIVAGVADQALAADVIATGNLTLLKKAMSFEAVWLDAHPDVLTTMDVEGVSQDGLSATYATRYAQLIAPLAMLCINRLSWKRAPIRIGKSRRRQLNRGNRDSAVRDDNFEWTPQAFGSTPDAR